MRCCNPALDIDYDLRRALVERIEDRNDIRVVNACSVKTDK